VKKYCLIFVLFIHAFAFAQQDSDYDLFLARQFMQNGEFAKAAEYFQDLYSKNQDEYYAEYLQLLLQLKEYEKAEKLIKSQYKYADENPLYLLDLGSLYQMQNVPSAAEKQFNKAIKELKPDRYSIQEIAQRFIKMNQPDLAQKTYLKGKDILRDKSAFNLDLADLFLLKNDFNSMIAAYLDEAPYQANNLSVIETGLQKAMADEKKKDALEKELLKRTQQDKKQFVYQDLLVWLYMQRNDFDAALLQAKSLDILRNEDGSGVMIIANAALEQKDYDAAIKGYQYVADKGTDMPWYETAGLALINTKREKIVNTADYTYEDLLSLKSSYLNYIQNCKSEKARLNATLELAQLQALYIHDYDAALALTEPLTDNNSIPKDILAKAKLYTGDYHLLKDEPWESLLLYTQVEKEQKGNPLGEEAKFRNAKLAYYKGDFEWSQTQLKILKASTSELISNDAIDLSVFILDNLNTDTTDFALMKFSKADLLLYQHKYQDALDTLSLIEKNYFGSSLTDDILYLKYKIEKQQQHYDKAATYLQKIIDNYAYDLLGDNAIFYLAELNQFYFINEEKSKELYEKIIIDYKDSTFAIEARKRYRKLRGDVN